MLTGSADGVITVWWLKSGVVLQRCKAHEGMVHDLQFDATRVVLCLAFTKAAGWCCQRKYVSRSVACLLLLVVVDCGNFATAFGTSVWVAVPGWLARASANNGVFGLKQSLLADYTPKGRRGRWNAVDSLQAGVWSGRPCPMSQRPPDRR
mgnify:CR=1 FL=1